MVDEKDDNVIHMDDRRMEDARLNRIEGTLNDLNAKVNNGLSSRSKETVQTIRRMDERYYAFEKVFVDHTKDDLIMKLDIEKIKEALDDVAATQKAWIRLAQHGTYIVSGALVGIIGWIFINIDWIAEVMEHVNTVIGGN